MEFAFFYLIIMQLARKLARVQVARSDQYLPYDCYTAGRAARLLHGACDMKKVNQDPTVMASIAAANEKVQKAVIDGMNNHLRGNRSLAAQTRRPSLVLR
jgi:hypothetical protein